MPSPDVIVVGGGVIGLAVADELARRGRSVTVIDDGVPGAWHVAAGMLAPVTEADFGEDPALGLESLALWPAFADRLGVTLDRAGTLAVARDADEGAALDRLHAFRTSLNLHAERLLGTKARRLEPALAPTVRLALRVDADLSVDPRAVVAALAESFTSRGINSSRIVRGRAQVVSAGGVGLEDGTALEADHVVLATGARALSSLPVRPVKGQVLRLRDPRGPGLVTRTIRAEGAYLVPRADGTYVLGATVEDRGFDASPTALGVYELLRDMSEVVPGVLELDLLEVLVGFRPATPDNVPAIGRLDGVVHATGHWRNGVLLAPITAQLVADVLDGAPPPPAVDAARFAKVAA